ncbi:MAG: dockerin type I repeat-containing protein [Oscillospiraceae bacterium]|nr:dockerin type I repeat-containing protein [Oscillospiraceae bacterium]
MLKKMTAIALTASMLLTALSAMPVNAVEEAPSATSWVPYNFLAARDFVAEHGLTYVADGMICFVTHGVNNPNVDGGESYVLLSKGEVPEPVYHETFTYDIEEPDPDSPTYKQDMQEFEEKLWRLGIHKELLGRMKYDYYDVYVFQPQTDGTLSFYLQNPTTAPEKDPHLYTFEVNGVNITETDLYGWLPDCYGEFRQYQKQYGNVSCKDDYIVYCGDISYAAGAKFEINQEGDAEIERVYSTNLTPRDGGVGGPDNILSLFKGTKPGIVKMSFDQVWRGDYSNVVSDTGVFEVKEDLSIEQLPDDYVVIPPAPLMGDLSGNGKNDVSDIIVLQKYVLGIGDLSNSDLADLNGDSCVDVFDLALLKRLVLQSRYTASDPTEPTEQPTETPTEPEQPTEPEPEDPTGYVDPTEAPVSKDVLVSCKNVSGREDGVELYDGQVPSESVMQIVYSLDELKAIVGDNFKIHEFTKQAFEDGKAVVVIRTAAGSGSCSYRVAGMVRNGSTLTAEVIRTSGQTVTADMVSKILLYSVEMTDVSGISKMVVQTQNHIIEDPNLDF